MRITILVDNIPGCGLEAEWGLAIYIEYRGHTILLDTGGSDLFAQNAAALGLDLGAVEFGVLSHAHWDHADGMGAFFRENPTAPFSSARAVERTAMTKPPKDCGMRASNRACWRPSPIESITSPEPFPPCPG